MAGKTVHEKFESPWRSLAHCSGSAARDGVYGKASEPSCTALGSGAVNVTGIAFGSRGHAGQ